MSRSRPRSLLAALFALVVAALSLGAPLAVAAPQPQEALTPVIANAIASPEPVLTSDGRRQLAYELQLINRTESTATIKSLKALAGKRVVESLAGAKLEEMMAPYGQRDHSIKLKPGQGAYVVMDVSLPVKARVPAQLTHRLTVSLKPPVPAVASSYEAAPVAVRKRQAVVVAPPLRGPGWVVANGCCDAFTAHRGTVLPVNGGAHVAERFAIDFVQIDPMGRLFEGPQDQFSSYPYFGDEVLSATPGKVVAVLDDVPETPAGSFPAHITAQEAGGNHIVVAMGHGRWAFYAHLQPGSIRVEVGQRVAVGQPLALLGNSGNSNAPHLHFHLMDGPLPLASNGVPYRFSNFEIEGTLGNLGPLEQGAVADVSPTPRGPRSKELPLNLQVIDFPGS